MSAATRADRQRLTALFVPEELAGLTADLTAEQATILDDFLARHLPAHTAILAASDDELSAVVERLLAQDGNR